MDSTDDRTVIDATRPRFIDNRDGNTLALALNNHLRARRQSGEKLGSLDIATAFFNVEGFSLIADELERVEKVRLLLGADPRPEPQIPERSPGDPEEPAFTEALVREDLSLLDAGLKRSRDHLAFSRVSESAVERLLSYLASGKIEVRRYEKQYLHAKAFVFRNADGAAVVGSSNLTYAGLRGSLELNLGADETVIGKIDDWFDELWEGAVPFDLGAIFDPLLHEYDPYLIYLRVLWELYGAELEQEREESSGPMQLPVTNFQKHGVWRALRIIEENGGAIVADGVGLGKTFLAGEVIRTYRQRRQKVLIVCPAALRDGTWEQFLHDFEFDRGVEYVSYEQLAADSQLGGDKTHLRNPLEDYALIVLDEAHNYRNPSSPARAGVLRRLLTGQRRDLLMLTATPVNNSLWDLYHLLRLFVRQDAQFARRGVLSLKQRFEEAMREDPFSLSPDLLFPIIDATTVKRTRRFVRRHYADDMIRFNGQMVPIRFPKPIAETVNYQLDEVLPGYFPLIEAALAPPSGEPGLTLARYQSGSYLLDQDEPSYETSLAGLIRTGLLKRFESSSHAFLRTLDRMISEHRAFLSALDAGFVPQKKILRELAAADDEDVFDDVDITEEFAADARLYNTERLRRDIEADLKVLKTLAEPLQSATVLDDPKLSALAEAIKDIEKRAQQEAASDADASDLRKVLIFSYFEDTVDHVEAYLERVTASEPSLQCYAGRIASVAGRSSRRGISREAAIAGFAPDSAIGGRRSHSSNFDILVCTDVLAEGLNLQQCRNIINFDLPWNPMRLVQRHGRIDRIGSKHTRVYLKTFFPDRELDHLLDLERRVLRKLAHAAYSIGVESAPIQGGTQGERSFVEARDEIDRLQSGDATIYEEGGLRSESQSGEEYRQELRRALVSRHEEILGLPFKAGSGILRGDQSGHFFLAGVGDRRYAAFVPLSPGEDIDAELGSCLRRIECEPATTRHLPDALRVTRHGAWERCRRYVYHSWMREADPANLQPRVSKFCRKLSEMLRDFSPTGVEQTRLQRALDAIEAPLARRDENELRAVLGTSRPSPDVSKRIVERVEELGLLPFEGPLPLPAISESEVQLICWLAVDGGSKTSQAIRS